MSNVSSSTISALSKGPLGSLLGGTSAAQKAAGEASVARMKAQMASSSAKTSAPSVTSPSVSSPSGGGSNRTSSSTIKVSGTQEAQKIAEAAGKQVEVVKIDPKTGQPSEIRMTDNPIPSRGLSGGAQLAGAVLGVQSTEYQKLASKEVQSAQKKAEAFLSGENVTLTESEKKLLHDYGYQGTANDQYYRDLFQQVLTEERKPLIERTQKSFAEFALGSSEAAAQAENLLEAYSKSPSVSTSTGKPIEVKGDTAALAVSLAKEFYPSYVQKQTSMGRTYLMSEQDMARILLSTGVGTERGLELALKGNLYSQFGNIGGSKSVQQYKTYLSEQESAKGKAVELERLQEQARAQDAANPVVAPEPVGKATTPQETAAYFDKVLAGVPTVKEAEADAARQEALEKKAKQTLALEAFTEASKDAQQEALATGKPVTLTQEKIADKAAELVSPGGKYEAGVPVVDDKAAAEALKINYAGLKAESIVEGAKAGTGSAFTLTDADVKALEKGGVSTEVAKEVQALPAQMKDYNVAAGKVEKMLDSAAKGQSPTVQLTKQDVAALEAVGFEGLQDKTGLTVAKPSEINSYVDYLTGKGSPDDAYGEPVRGVGSQPKTPFAYEFLGPRGEVMKGNLAIVKYEAPDPTNPYKVVKVYKAPQYGPQPRATEAGPKVPEPSGNVIADLMAGGKAPLENLFKQVGEIGSGIGLGFEAIGEIAAGKGPGESRAAKKVGELEPPKYGYDVEMEVFSLGVRGASDLIQKGETDVGTNDIEKLSDAFMKNPFYVLGNVGATAVVWIGPQAVTKGIKLAQTGVSVVKPLRVYEAERLAATAAKPLGIDEVGIQALRQDTPLAAGPFGYFLRPVGPASGRVLYPELQVVGDAAKLGLGKTTLKIPTSPESVIIRSGVDTAAQEIGVILPKAKQVKMVTAPLTEEEKILLRGLEPPKVGIGPPAPRKLQPGEIAAKTIEDVYGEGFTGAEAGKILGTDVKVSTLAEDVRLIQEPLSFEANIPKLGKVGFDLAERAPERILRESKLIKYQGKDPIASIVTFAQKDVSSAARVGAKRADQIQKANEALEEISKLSAPKPAPRVQERGLAAIVQQLEKDAAKAPDLSVLKAGKTAKDTTKAAEAAASAMLGAGAAVARSLGHGGATGAERVHGSASAFDYGYDVVRYPPGVQMPEMARTLLDLTRLKVDLPLMSLSAIKVDLSDLYGLKTVPTEREDLADLLGLSRLLDTSTRLDEGTRLDVGLRDLTATRQDTKQDLVFERTTPEIPPYRIPTIPTIRIPPLFGDKKLARKKKYDDELITPGLKEWLLFSVESIVGGGPARLEGYDSGAQDFNSFMYGSKKGRGRRR